MRTKRNRSFSIVAIILLSLAVAAVVLPVLSFFFLPLLALLIPLLVMLLPVAVVAGLSYLFSTPGKKPGLTDVATATAIVTEHDAHASTYASC